MDTPKPNLHRVGPTLKGKMKLTDLLNRITPLPWRKPPMMAAVLVSTETLANEAYACHAANVLPDLLRGIEHAIEALYNAPEVRCKYDQQHSDTHLAAVVELKELLAKAENISLQRQPDNHKTHHANGTHYL